MVARCVRNRGLSDHPSDRLNGAHERRKGEVTGRMNEHCSRSQLELLPGSFRSQNLEF
jgi:hypothetical protein